MDARNATRWTSDTRSETEFERRLASEHVHALICHEDAVLLMRFRQGALHLPGGRIKQMADLRRSLSAKLLSDYGLRFAPEQMSFAWSLTIHGPYDSKDVYVYHIPITDRVSLVRSINGGRFGAFFTVSGVLNNIAPDQRAYV